MLHRRTDLAHLLVALVAAIAVAVGPLGCKKIKQAIEDKALEKAGIEKVEGDEEGNKSFTLKGAKPGEEVTFGTTQKLPDNFPSDVPVYPGAKVMAAASSGQEAFSVTWTTNDPVASIVEFYNSKIPGDSDRMAMGNMLSYTANQRRITLMTNENEGAASAVNSVGKTIIVLTVGPAEQPSSKKAAAGPPKPKK